MQFTPWLWSHTSQDFKRVSPFSTKSVMLGKKVTKWPGTPLIPVPWRQGWVDQSQPVLTQFRPSQCYIVRLRKTTCASVSLVQNVDTNGTCFLQLMIKCKKYRFIKPGPNLARGKQKHFSDLPTRLRRELLRNSTVTQTQHSRG